MKAMNSLKLWVAVACLAGMLPAASMAQYLRTDLVSNQTIPGVNTDAKHLVNAWGLTQLQIGSGATPFWISDNATGFSTLYRGGGQQNHLFVTIPPAPGSPAGTLGAPTGTVGNSSPTPTDFTITENGKSGRAFFIFATLDGTISGWNPGVDGIDFNTGLSHSTIAIDRSGVGAIYTGLAIATNESGQTFLFAADDGPNRRIDRIDGSFDPNHVMSFSDPAIPQDFTPYGIQEINGQIWVTFTALNKAQGGFVDVFDTEGNVLQHFAVHGPLHSPWGIAKAPADFGPMSNAILISNNTSRGRVNAFDANGNFLGPLRDATGQVIEIDQLWGIRFGLDGGPNTAHNQLFFTAGPNNYGNGLFGVITPPAN